MLGCKILKLSTIDLPIAIVVKYNKVSTYPLPVVWLHK
jgi:hypothetical protein